MPLQFKAPVVSRISTVSLERQLLNALIGSKIELQRTLGKHRSEFFTNNARSFIYDCVNKYFREKHTTLSRDQFVFEVEKCYDTGKDKAKIDDLVSEYDIIIKSTQTDGVDSIIANLETVQIAAKTESLIKEAYEKLESGDYSDAVDLLREKSLNLMTQEKEGRVINLHKDSDDWFEEVRRRKEHPELYAGIPSGFEKFDKLTGGFFNAELTVVFGLSGKGKSTFMKALTCNIRKQGRVVLHCGNEENEFQMRSKYMSADSGEKYSPFKRGTYTDEEYRRLKIYSDNARGVGAIYIYEFPQQTDTTYIERAYRFLEMQGVHVDVIVVDYLDLMKPSQKAYSENDEQGKVTSDLKQLAIDCNCPVITATQAGIQSEKQETKAKPFLNQSDVFGTKRKVHSANCLIGIVNQTATAKANELDVNERTKHHLVLCVPKNRDGAVFTFRQVMDVECGKFYEDTDTDDPAMENLEKQAKEMIDETLPPDKMRTCIDINEMQQATQAGYQKRLAKLMEEQQEAKTEFEKANPLPDDEFTKEAPVIHDDNGKAPEGIPVNEFEDDDFLKDAPASSSSDTQPEKTPEEKSDDDDFFSDAPDAEKKQSETASGEDSIEFAEEGDAVSFAAPETPATSFTEKIDGLLVNELSDESTDPEPDPEPDFEPEHDFEPEDDTDEQPVEQKDESPVEMPIAPVEQPVEQPVDKLIDQHVEQPNAIQSSIQSAEPIPEKAIEYTAQYDNDGGADPMTPFDDGVHEIPHKKSMAEILAEKRRKAAGK